MNDYVDPHLSINDSEKAENRYQFESNSPGEKFECLKWHQYSDVFPVETSQHSPGMVLELEQMLRSLLQRGVAADWYSAVTFLGFEELLDTVFSFYCSARLARQIAECSSTPAQVLEKLARHSDPQVRESVAESAKTPVVAQWQLAHDDNPDVRLVLAEACTTDTRVLEALSRDDNPFVSNRAERTLRRLAIEKQELRTEQLNPSSNCTIFRMRAI